MAKRIRRPQSRSLTKPSPADELSWDDLAAMEGVLDFLENEGVSEGETHEALFRIAEAVERLAPPPPAAPDFDAADAFAWHPDGRRLAPVARVNRVDMALLKGIDRVRDLLVENTERFARGLPANNALLWGARGMGKSSLVKAVHAAVNGAGARGRAGPGPLKLVEIHREDIESLPDLMALMREAPLRFIVFCD